MGRTRARGPGLIGRPGRRPGRGRALATLLPVLAAVLLIGRDAAAVGVGRATWTPRAATAVAAVAGFRTFRDSVYVFVRMRWNRDQRDGLRVYEADGLRYTQELHDMTGRLSATGYWVSDLPGAAYDRDDDDGDGRWEEAEVTATEGGAIRAGRRYVVGIQFSRWSRRCESDACPWRWTYRAGEIALISQLSRFFLGEWQAQRYTDPYRSVRIPRQARPAPEAGQRTAGAFLATGTGPHGRPVRCGGPFEPAVDGLAVCAGLGVADARLVAITTATTKDRPRARDPVAPPLWDD